jgi:hypothetical protein
VRFSTPIHNGSGAHPASYTMGTGSFPGLKWLRRGIDHPPPSNAEVKERVELYLYSPSGPSRPVLGWTLPFYDVLELELVIMLIIPFCFRKIFCYLLSSTKICHIPLEHASMLILREDMLLSRVHRSTNMLLSRVHRSTNMLLSRVHRSTNMLLSRVHRSTNMLLSRVHRSTDMLLSRVHRSTNMLLSRVHRSTNKAHITYFRYIFICLSNSNPRNFVLLFIELFWEVIRNVSSW